MEIESGLPKRKPKQPFNKDNDNNKDSSSNNININTNINTNTNFISKILGSGMIGNENNNKIAGNKENNEPQYIYLNVQGVIENSSFFDGDNIYCQYEIVHGPDWKIINGEKRGKSQLACQGEGNEKIVVWNLPFEVCLQSTNPYGWPQLIISCYNPDFFGRDVVKAYGTVFFPTTPGEHKRTLSTFSTISSSKLIEIIGIFLGEKAELRDPAKSLSTGEGREIVKGKCEGEINVSFNVEITNMEEFGYNL